MIRRPPRSTLDRSSAASDVYKRQLGSRELVLLISTFMFFYLKMTRGKKAAYNFLFTVGVGIFVIVVTKSITSKHEELYLKSVLVETLSNFPSGHTFIATVLYFSLAKNLSTKMKYELVNRYLFISAIIIVAVVGISRFIGSCLLYTSPSPRDRTRSRMPSSA